MMPILILLVSLAPVSGVFFTPALPLLTEEFGLSEAVAQWSMTIFLIAYSLGQLPYGPIANRWGRKKALFIGFDIAFVGALLCLFANSFWLFCIGRFIQAIGAAAGIKVVFTMISDRHEGNAAAKTFSYFLMAFAMMPGLGMLLGGFITIYSGWRGCFAFLAGYTLLLSFLIRLLPETSHSLNKEAFNLHKISHDLGKHLKDPFLILHGLLMGAGTATTYVFATVAPYLCITDMGLLPDIYGLWTLLPPIGVVIGLYLTLRIAHRVTPRIGMLSGLLLVFIGILVLGGLFHAELIVPAALFLPMILIQTGFGLSYSLSASKSLGEAKDKSNASAVLQFTNISIATIATLVVGFCLPIQAITLVGIFCILAVFAFTIWLKLKEHHQ